MAYNVRHLATLKQNAPSGQQELVHIAVFSDQLNGSRHGGRGRQREQQEDLSIVANTSTL